MKKNQIIKYLDDKCREVLDPLRKKLKNLKEDERIKAIKENYPDYIPAVEKYINSVNAVCDIADRALANDFQLDIARFVSRENRNVCEFILAKIWMRHGWQYSADVDALENKIHRIKAEYITLKGNIKGMNAKKAIEYLESLGFDIQPEAPSYLPIAPVDTQLLLGN